MTLETGVPLYGKVQLDQDVVKIYLCIQVYIM